MAFLTIFEAPSINFASKISGETPSTHFSDIRAVSYQLTTMTKAELVAIVCDNTGLEREEVSRTVDAFLDAIKDSLARGENVYMRGFGTFQNKYRARKVARNILAQTEVIIEPHFTPTFKPSDAFSDKVKHSPFISELSKMQAPKKGS